MNDCSYVVPEGVITMTEKQKKNLVRILIAAALTVLATQLPLTGAPRLAGRSNAPPHTPGWEPKYAPPDG